MRGCRRCGACGGGVGQQLKGLLLLLRVVFHGGLVIKLATGLVGCLQKHLAFGQTVAVHAVAQGKGRGGKPQWILMLAVNVERIVFHSQKARELTRASVGRPARLVGKADYLRQLGMLRAPGPHYAVDTGWDQKQQPRIENVVATLYSALGIDWKKRIRNTPSGRTYAYVDSLGSNGIIPTDDITSIYG